MGSTPRVIGSLALSVGGMSLAILSACSAPANPGATITVTETVTSSPGAEDLGMSGEAPKEPANPVPLLERVQGCIPEGGTEVGDHDINGNRYASCSFLQHGRKTHFYEVAFLTTVRTVGGSGNPLSNRNYTGAARLPLPYMTSIKPVSATKGMVQCKNLSLSMVVAPRFESLGLTATQTGRP